MAKIVKRVDSMMSDESFVFLFNVSMVFTFFSSFTVAFWLFQRAPQFRMLAIYCMGMGLWSIGLYLIQSAPWQPFSGVSVNSLDLGRWLVNIQPLLPCLFLHFCLHFLSVNQNSWAIRFQKTLMTLLYVCGIGFVAMAIAFDQGQIQPWLVFSQFYHLNSYAVVGLIFAVSVGAFAHLLLLLAYSKENEGIKEREDSQQNNHVKTQKSYRAQLSTLFISAGWGFLLASSYVFASFEFAWLPYSLLLLPTYIVFLVFGIIRYHLFEVNAFAERIAIWTLLLAACLIVLGLFSTLAGQAGFTPFNEISWLWLWSYSAVLLLLSALLFNPMRRFANRIIYPNSQVNQSVLQQWQYTLNQSDSFDALNAQAQSLLLKHCGLPVVVEFSADKDSKISNELAIYCYAPESQNEGSEDTHQQGWRTELINWQHASPSVRHVAEVFASVLAQHAQTLTRSLEIAALKQSQALRQAKQQHLAEVGTMTAAIAHELRNPLNIIAMANVQNQPEIESIIKDQLSRANVLIGDVLEYTRELMLNCHAVNVLALIEANVQQIIPLSSFEEKVEVQIDIDSDMICTLDGFRFNQVISNILQNAVKALTHQKHPQIHISGFEQDHKLHLRIGNNGEAMVNDIKETLFQPFVTRSQGGTGLGLAICKRIIEAHGGSIRLLEDELTPPNQTCTFEIIVSNGALPC
jgi:signal transduction histidine kinase